MMRYAELRTRDDAPPGSSWGLFGSTDEVGMLNFLTPERVCEAARLVRRGAVFNLDLPLDAFDPPVSAHRGAPRHTIFQANPNHRDDYLDGLFLQGSSQIDGLRHFRHPDHGFYNGTPDAEVEVGSPRLGVNRLAERGVVGRGVLIDLERYLSAAGTPIDQRSAQPIDVAVLDRAASAQGVELRAGDIIVLRTGWLSHVLHGLTPQERVALRLDIRSPGLAQTSETVAWLWDRQVALVAADNLAVECYPPAPGSPFVTTAEARGEESGAHTGMLHRVLIPLLGLTLGELWSLDRLAADCAATGVWEFLLVAKPLNLVGGVGSPANALAVK